MNEVILQSQYYKFEPSALAVMVMKHQPIRKELTTGIMLCKLDSKIECYNYKIIMCLCAN